MIIGPIVGTAGVSNTDPLQQPWNRCTVERFTVLGANGYVGAALVAQLHAQGHRVHAVTRAALPVLLDSGRNAGHVLDCIGLTGDFRSRPHETADAHVGVTAACLARLAFDSFLFLSSTRVYARATATAEDTPLPCAPQDPSDLYNLSKLTGEALCLADPRPGVRVVRVSNVYGRDLGTDTFLGQVLRAGARDGVVRFDQAAASEKDYISRDELTRVLPAIALAGRARLYNLAAGRNTSHAAIATALHDAFGWRCAFAVKAPRLHFPPIDITRLTNEFGPVLSDLSADLPTLWDRGQEVPCSPSTSPPDA